MNAPASPRSWRFAFALLTILPFCAAPLCPADEKGGDHTHEKRQAGPNGGRVVKDAGDLLEFLVLKDRRVQLTFLDKELKPTPAGRQVAKIYAGSRQSPTVLSFEKKGDLLVSDKALPAGDTFPVVLQVKARPIARYATAKFQCDLRECASCDALEYACVCHHHHH